MPVATTEHGFVMHLVQALFWKGLMARAGRLRRCVAVAFMIIALLFLSILQFGFVGIGAFGTYESYVVVLLVPTVASSLLLGVILGTALGAVAGVIVLVHAIMLPLDYYEMLFLTPLTSLLLFTGVSLLSGILFAVIMPRVSSRVFRLLAIVLISFGVSWAWSFAFRGTVVHEITSGVLVQSLGIAEGESDPGRYAEYLGSFDIQVLVDAAFVAVACVIIDLVTRRHQSQNTTPSIKRIFNRWLLVVVALTFMLVSMVGFIVVTIQDINSAFVLMQDETSYIGNQLQEFEYRQSLIDDLVAEEPSMSLSLEKLRQQFTPDRIVEGYSLDRDGVVFAVRDGVIVVSDVAYLKQGEPIADHVSEGAIDLIRTASSQDLLLQTLFAQNAYASQSVESDESNDPGKTDSPTPHAPLVLAFAYAQDVGNYTIVMIQTTNMVFASRLANVGWIGFATIVMLLAVYFLASRVLGLVVVRRINEVNATLKSITMGNLDAKVVINDSQEMTSLSAGINTMVDTLQGWINEANTRIDRELAAARAIQESALPSTFPPFPNIMSFDIYASAHPAREVGGDFYDFFLIDDAVRNEMDTPSHTTNKLGFVIADVSGKGVPASLFMMAAKSQIRNYLVRGMELGEAIENANRQLCEGNTSGTFVTVFAGVLDYTTGHVTYVNAGHNPTLWWHDGSWRQLNQVSGMPLGLFDGLSYRSFEVDCTIGDEFLLYTDGVTEAMNTHDELYGMERLERLVTMNYYLHPRELIACIQKNIAAYTAGAEPSDDITMLALEYGVPPENTSTLEVLARVDELPHVNAFIHTELEQRLCPLRVQQRLDIAIEEFFVNVASYAYPQATPENPGTVLFAYTYATNPSSITVEIIDHGVAFDPLAQPEARKVADASAASVGGLGIMMARNSVDSVSYTRVDGANVITIKQSW